MTTESSLPTGPGRSGRREAKAGGRGPSTSSASAQLVSEYLIPVETNSVWYSLGGVLAISLGLEIVTGFLLALLYVPDAAVAYGITANFLASPGWSIVLSFHFYNAFLIFALVMVHMLRVFISGSYRGAKTGLWLVGVGLAGLAFALSLTGEALHWDEVGFGVPWNIGEFLDAIGLAGLFNYATDGLTNISTATEKLAQLYALHIAIVPIVLGAFIVWHYLLIRLKGISTPFWLRISGRTDLVHASHPLVADLQRSADRRGSLLSRSSCREPPARRLS